MSTETKDKSVHEKLCDASLMGLGLVEQNGQLRQERDTLKAMLREAKFILKSYYDEWAARNPIDENHPSRYVPPRIDALRELIWRIEKEIE